MSLFLQKKKEMEEDLPSLTDYKKNEASIISLLKQRSQILKDYLDTVSNNGSNTTDDDSLAKNLTTIDDSIDSKWDDINNNLQDIFKIKGIHSETLMRKKNITLSQLFKQTDSRRKQIQETQQNIEAIRGEKEDSDLTVNAYGFHYFIFITLTIVITVTTVISASKSDTHLAEWIILVFFCLLIVYRFYEYLTTALPIWWSNFKGDAIIGINRTFS